MLATLPRRYRFGSYQEFATFDQELTRQLAGGQVLAASAPETALRQASAYYRPSAEAQLWALSEPDNAWRGYFLPLAEARAYEAQLTGRDRRMRLGCLLAAALLGSLAAWALAG